MKSTVSPILRTRNRIGAIQNTPTEESSRGSGIDCPRELPTFTDSERLDFVAKTGAFWARSAYRNSGMLRWDCLNNVMQTAGEDFRQALDAAMVVFRQHGGMFPIREAYALVPPPRASSGYVIIYGPQGCGKTFNASRFASHYGGHCMDFSQFNFAESPRQNRGVNVLFATSREEAISALLYVRKHCQIEMRIVAFEDALNECRRA